MKSHQELKAELQAARAKYHEVSMQAARAGLSYTKELLEADEGVSRAQQACGIPLVLALIEHDAARLQSREHRSQLRAAAEAISYLAEKHGMPGLAVDPGLRESLEAMVEPDPQRYPVARAICVALGLPTTYASQKAVAAKLSELTGGKA